MAKLRVHNFTVSLEGYGAGPDQNAEEGLGRGGEQPHGWMIATRGWREMTDGIERYEIAERVVSEAATHFRLVRR